MLVIITPPYRSQKYLYNCCYFHRKWKSPISAVDLQPAREGQQHRRNLLAQLRGLWTHLATPISLPIFFQGLVIGVIEERRTNTNDEPAETETRQCVFYEIGSSSAEEGSAGAVVFTVVTWVEAVGYERLALGYQDWVSVGEQTEGYVYRSWGNRGWGKGINDVQSGRHFDGRFELLQWECCDWVGE